MTMLDAMCVTMYDNNRTYFHVYILIPTCKEMILKKNSYHKKFTGTIKLDGDVKTHHL